MSFAKPHRKISRTVRSGERVTLQKVHEQSIDLAIDHLGNAGRPCASKIFKYSYSEWWYYHVFLFNITYNMVFS